MYALTMDILSEETWDSLDEDAGDSFDFPLTDDIFESAAKVERKSKPDTADSYDLHFNSSAD